MADPDARVILDAVARKLENAPISPEEKASRPSNMPRPATSGQVKLASAAAQAYLRRAATTTSFETWSTCSNFTKWFFFTQLLVLPLTWSSLDYVTLWLVVFP